MFRKHYYSGIFDVLLFRSYQMSIIRTTNIYKSNLYISKTDTIFIRTHSFISFNVSITTCWNAIYKYLSRITLMEMI